MQPHVNEIYVTGSSKRGQLGFSPDDYYRLLHRGGLSTPHAEDSSTNGEIELSEWIPLFHRLKQMSNAHNTVVPTSFQVKKIACGGGFTIMITMDGKAYSCGSDRYGQLCVNMSGTGGLNLITFPSTPRTASEHVRISDVTCGDVHVLFTTEDGYLMGCGYNEDGELCMGFEGNLCYPRLANPESFNHSRIRLMEAGFYHTIFVTEDDKIWSAGYNGFGASLGLGPHNTTNKNLPHEISLNHFEFGQNTVVLSLACGKWHTLMLVQDGRSKTRDYGCCYSMGYNSNLQNGHSVEHIDVPTKISALKEPIRLMAAGDDYSIFYTIHRTFYVCGTGTCGEIGIEGGTTFSLIGPSPNLTKKFAHTVVTGIACGMNHSLFVTKNGEVYGCGYTEEAEIGISSSDLLFDPVCTLKLKTSSRLTAVCGANYSMVYCVALQDHISHHFSKLKKVIHTTVFADIEICCFE